MNIVSVICCCAFVVAGATPAHAFCMFGFGHTCPIRDATAEELIRPHVGGRASGSLKMTFRIHWRGYEDQGLQEIDRAKRVIDLLGGGNCSDLKRIFPQNSYGQITSEDCRLASTAVQRGLMKAELRIITEPLLSRSVSVILNATPEGEAQMKSVTAARSDQSVILVTRTFRFARILRTRNDANASAPSASVEFEYDMIPNVWAHVEKFQIHDELPTIRRIGRAAFEKWSDGWRLNGKPQL